MADAFQRLQRESDEQDGRDLYSGGFNTIQEYHDLTAKWKSSGLAAGEFLEQDERLEQLEKREANAVCLQAPTSELEGEYMFVGMAAM